jgi:uncharacterized protein
MRRLYLIGGYASLILGVMGVVLPIMPTVPFLILAAWCFGKSNPAFESRLLAHPRYGHHIRLWREKRAIARIGKIGASAAFAASVIGSLLVMPAPWSFLPLGIAVIALSWIWTRPDG